AQPLLRLGGCPPGAGRARQAGGSAARGPRDPQADLSCASMERWGGLPGLVLAEGRGHGWSRGVPLRARPGVLLLAGRGEDAGVRGEAEATWGGERRWVGLEWGEREGK